MLILLKTSLFYVISESRRPCMPSPYTKKTDNDHEADVIRDGSFEFIWDDYS